MPTEAISSKNCAENDTTYNGWKNRETWALNLWFNNDQGLYLMMNEFIEECKAELAKLTRGQGDYATRRNFLEAVIESCEGVITYARRYSDLALSQAAECTDSDRKAELLTIAEACDRVPAKPARSFHEACQGFWFIQQLMQMESSGHSISPGRFDQYMYPFFKADLDAGKITYEAAQELLDCIWVKLNDLNKVRDAASAEGFAGYGLFQNLIVGGQDEYGLDATNDLSYMCMEAQMHVRLPQPSLSIRVWNGSPHSLLIKAAAVSDYTPAAVADSKMKKKDGELSIELRRTQDILKHLGANKREGQFLCGFSMETDNVIENSRKKLSSKNCDMICANSLRTAGAGFGVDTNIITLITADGETELALMSKDDAAHEILNVIRDKMA